MLCETCFKLHWLPDIHREMLQVTLIARYSQRNASSYTDCQIFTEKCFKLHWLPDIHREMLQVTLIARYSEKCFKLHWLPDIHREMLQVTLIARYSQRNASSYTDCQIFTEKCFKLRWEKAVQSMSTHCGKPKSNTINLLAPWTSDHCVWVFVCARRVLLGQTARQLQKKSFRWDCRLWFLVCIHMKKHHIKIYI